jgi:hypothetical protein
VTLLITSSPPVIRLNRLEIKQPDTYRRDGLVYEGKVCPGKYHIAVSTQSGETLSVIYVTDCWKQYYTHSISDSVIEIGKGCDTVTDRDKVTTIWYTY